MQWLRLHTPSVGGLGSIPGQGTRSHMPQLKVWMPQLKRSCFPQLKDPTAAAKSLQSCSILCDPIGGSPPGSPLPGILQARTLERVAIAFSDMSQLKNLHATVKIKDSTFCN